MSKIDVLAHDARAPNISAEETQAQIASRVLAAARARASWLNQPYGHELIEMLKRAEERCNQAALRSCEPSGTRDESVANRARAQAMRELLETLNGWKLPEERYA